jgi:hypothetical protein
MALSTASRAASMSRVRTGICIRKEYLDKDGVRRKCSKAATREAQTPIGAFVCSECGARLVPLADRRPVYGKAAAAGVIALLLVGGGGYFGYRYLHQPQHPACTVKERLPDLVANMKPAQITALAAACFAENDFQNALPLYFTAAGQGDAAAMLAIAHMYDPTTFQPNKPFGSPNPRQAAEWYLRAAETGAGDDTARKKLREWLQARARDGNTEARQTLEDFWK